MPTNDSVQVVEADLRSRPHRDALVRLLDTYAQDEMGIGRPLEDAVSQRLVEELQEHPCCLILLAQVESKSVGLAICFLGYSTFAARPLVNLHDLIVEPGFRGQGIGCTVARSSGNPRAGAGLLQGDARSAFRQRSRPVALRERGLRLGPSRLQVLVQVDRHPVAQITSVADTVRTVLCVESRGGRLFVLHAAR